MGVLAYIIPPLEGPEHGPSVKTTISADIQGRPNFLLINLFRHYSAA